MSIEAINKVTKAEQDAAKLIGEASIKAKTIVVEAQEKARRDFEVVSQASALKSSELCENARREAKEQSQVFLKGVQKECEELKNSVSDRIDGAVAIVVEKVVNG